MRKLLLALFLIALLYVPPTDSTDHATVSVESFKAGFAPSAYIAPIEVYTPQQSRSSELHRRIPIEIFNVLPNELSGPVKISISFPSGRELYVENPSDYNGYYLEVRDSEGSLLLYQVDVDKTVLSDANHASSIELRVLVSVPALSKVTIYVYYSIEAVTRTPPYDSSPRSVSESSIGYDISYGSLTYKLRTKPIVFSPLTYILNPGIEQISYSSTPELGADYSLPIYESFRSSVFRTIFYLYNNTYYQSEGFYIPVAPYSYLAIINPNYQSSGRPYNGNSADQAYPGALGGYLARRIKHPPSNIVSYSKYGRPFVGALYIPGSITLDGNYDKDPTAAKVADDPDFRNEVGYNYSFPRINNSNTYYSYIAYSNHINSQSTVSSTLYAYLAPMHAIENIKVSFSTYIEFLIYAPRDASYTFSFGTDDQLRVRIDGKLSISARILQGLRRYSTSFHRKAGTRHYVQIERAEGGGYYDLRMKRKVTNPNDPNDVYVEDQITRLESIAVPFSRAVAPQLDAAMKRISLGPLFAKLSFKDAPLVPLRGVLPEALEADRYDISLGNMTFDYVFFPNGDFYVQYDVRLKDEVAEDAALMPYRKFSENKPEEALTGNNLVGSISFPAGSFSVSEISARRSSYYLDASAIRINYTNNVALIASINLPGISIYRSSVPLASFVDSSTSTPGDLSPNSDVYTQDAIGFYYSSLDAVVKIYFHVYIPGVTENVPIEEVLAYSEVSVEPKSLETSFGLNVTILDLSSTGIEGVYLELYYNGTTENATSLFLGNATTDSHGAALFRTAVFSGEYTLFAAYNTSIGRVNDSYTFSLTYPEIVGGTIDKSFSLDVVRISLSLAYADGTPIEHNYPSIGYEIDLYYGSTLIENSSSYSFTTEYLPADRTYTINATIDLYGYKISKLFSRSSSNDTAALLPLDVVPLDVYVTYHDGTTGESGTVNFVPIEVVYPGNVRASFIADMSGHVSVPIVPIGENVTVVAHRSHAIRGEMTLSESIIPSLSEHSLTLEYEFRRLTLRVVDADNKPLSGISVDVGPYRLVTNVNGEIRVSVPSSSYYGAISVYSRITDYGYLVPVTSEVEVNIHVYTTTTYTLQFPMRDITVKLVDVNGEQIDDIARIVLSSNNGTLFDGYITGGSITFRHMNIDPLFNLSVTVYYSYNITVYKPIRYAPSATNTTVELPISKVSVYVYASYTSGSQEALSGVIVHLRSSVEASAYTNDTGYANFGYLPLSSLVGDYNASVSVEIAGIIASERKSFTLDQYKIVSISISLTDVEVHIYKPNGENALAKLRLYLDGSLSRETIVNGSGILYGIPVKYASNVTFEALYKTPYGYLVSASKSFSDYLSLQELAYEHNVSIEIPVGSLEISLLSVPLEAEVTIYLGNVTVSQHGMVTTFEEIPYGTREVKISVETRIAPIEFRTSVSVEGEENSYAISLPITSLTINVEASMNATVLLSVTVPESYGGSTGSISLEVHGTLTIEGMPYGNYTYDAIHVTSYGLPIESYGSFELTENQTEITIGFNLSTVSFYLTYPGEASIEARIVLSVQGASIAKTGSNVTFEEIPYGTRTVYIEYTNVATLLYSQQISVEAPKENFTVSLPIKDIQLEVKDRSGRLVEASITLNITSGDYIEVPGSISLDVVGIKTLYAMPIGEYRIKAIHLTSYGVSVESLVEKSISLETQKISISVPAGELSISVLSEDEKKIPLSILTVKFPGIASTFRASVPNGSIVLVDFPYGVEATFMVNATFYGIEVRTSVNASVYGELSIKLPVKDVSISLKDKDTGGPAAGAKVILYYNASGSLIEITSGVTDSEGRIEFEFLPTEAFMKQKYGEGYYVLEIEYKNAKLFVPLSEATKGVEINPPVEKTLVATVVLAVALVAIGTASVYYIKKIRGPYHRLKKAISKGKEIDVSKLPTRDEEILDTYERLIGKKKRGF